MDIKKTYLGIMLWDKIIAHKIIGPKIVSQKIIDPTIVSQKLIGPRGFS